MTTTLQIRYGRIMENRLTEVKTEMLPVPFWTPSEGWDRSLCVPLAGNGQHHKYAVLQRACLRNAAAHIRINWDPFICRTTTKKMLTGLLKMSPSGLITMKRCAIFTASPQNIENKLHVQQTQFLSTFHYFSFSRLASLLTRTESSYINVKSFVPHTNFSPSFYLPF